MSVNCAAIPRDLIPSELFGHEKGAFTGATQRRLGRFELADGGTIFLDEVGELLPDTQVALLRVLQERELERVGGRQPIHVNVRVITATNRDLEAGVANGAFRQDLFYRLNVFPIEVPPLRERKTDLLLLVEYFVQRYGAKAGKDIRSIDKKTLDLFQSYDWPGNIRELQNVIERSVILSSGGVFSVDELWLSKKPVSLAPPVKASPLANNRVEPLGERERLPVFSPRMRHPALSASGMLVPEASMNENHFPAGRKNNIWFSGEVLAVQPESIAHAVEHPSQQKFGGCVLRAYLPHVGTAPFGGELVHARAPYTARSSGRSEISLSRLPLIMIFSDSTESPWPSSSTAAVSSGSAK